MRDSVRCLNVSVISDPAAMNRLLYVCTVTDAMLSIVESTPVPYTVVVVRNRVQLVSGSYMVSGREMRWMD